MEGGLVKQGGDRVRKVGYVKEDMSKKRKPYRRFNNPSVFRVPRALQKLFVSCRETFKGPDTFISPQDVQRLCNILDIMKAEDVGLSKDLEFFNPDNILKENPRVTCTTMYQCNNFSLCIFFIPENGVIPLHNHPGMTVFSKLLIGKMHIKSYDLVEPSVSHNNLLHHPSRLRLAKLKANNVYTAPCDTSVLFPNKGGNIHEFTAITPCAVLDVIGPPYSKEDGRDCTYYRDYPYTTFPNGEIGERKEENDSYGWLEEIEVPENSEMDWIEYLGPPITETTL
ncbi:hypothetical protein TanjilG_01534 [Lupinus angustifolius]|uniref:plant cysteine oxidase 2-like n=1 Tax=Lupinus angustifolius TaxID=3871 RepID=UPI00090DA2D3|nr:PREDICTED: plant cysteine oxidase 2-like [Lupinus angustifolius]OIV90080.1 hypothetical protein TanjilG_01534 [Lupinus angustifolius]